MPMTSPRMLTRGPPELPRLMAASVWMKRRKLAPGSVCRSLVEMMPAVNLCSRPNGEPPASTPSPTRPASGGPRGTAGQLAARVHLDDGDVGLLVGADDRAAQLLARLELDHDARHALDDVVVGEDDPLRVDDEAAPDPARGAADAAGDLGERGGEGFGRAGDLGGRGRRVVERGDARAAEHRADGDADDEAGRRQRRDPHAELAQDLALRLSRLALRDLQHRAVPPSNSFRSREGHAGNAPRVQGF